MLRIAQNGLSGPTIEFSRPPDDLIDRDDILLLLNGKIATIPADRLQRVLGGANRGCRASICGKRTAAWYVMTVVRGMSHHYAIDGRSTRMLLIRCPRLPANGVTPCIGLLHQLPNERRFCVAIRMTSVAVLLRKAIFQGCIRTGIVRMCAQIVPE
jgi:hypothetical protein